MDGVSQPVTGKDTIMYGGREAKLKYDMLRHVREDVQKQLCAASQSQGKHENLFVKKAIVKV